MEKTFDIITPEISAWLKRQRLFFVATAPLSADGNINCSPKGVDTFRILGPREVAYLDLTESGIETVSTCVKTAASSFCSARWKARPRSSACTELQKSFQLGPPGSTPLDVLSKAPRSQSDHPRRSRTHLRLLWVRGAAVRISRGKGYAHEMGLNGRRSSRAIQVWNRLRGGTRAI